MIESSEFEALADYFNKGIIPTIDQYHIFEYMKLDCSVYDLSMVVENDMRENMYVTNDTKYEDMHYGMRKLDKYFWDNLEIPFPEGDNILVPYRRLVKQPFEDIMFKLEKMFLELTQIKGVFIAGGAIFCTMFGLPINDVDLFIYDGTIKEANARLKIIHNIYLHTDPKITRTTNAITISNIDYFNGSSVIRYSYKEVQVILRLYKTKSEILHGFDVDSCCFGYDGSSIWMTKRAEHFLLSGLNHVNFNRISPSYEHRLGKYLCRGVGVKIPGFSKNLIDTTMLKEYFKSFLTKDGNYNTYKTNRQSFKLAGIDKLLFYYWKNYLNGTKKGMKYNVDSIDISVSDYYMSKNRYAHEKWLDEIIEYMYNTADKYLEASEKYMPLLDNMDVTNILTNHIIKARRITYLTVEDNNLDSIINIEESLYEALSYVSKWEFPRVLEWKVTNPGEQMTGTFHKTVLEDNSIWYKGSFYKHD